MSLRYTERRSPIAPWSMRLSLLCLQMLIVGIVLHRFASMPTSLALNLLIVAIAGALLAALIAVWAFGRIWVRGETGIGAAAVGLLIGMGVALWPAAFLPQLLSHPYLYDVSTDQVSPPAFSALAAVRAENGRPTGYPGEAFAETQRKAYPEIEPIVTPKGSFDAFVVAREVAKSLGWEIVRESEPPKEGGTGIIEATDTTLVMGFTDDIAIRVTGDSRISRIDVRSASRAGLHDLGRNAERVRTALKQMYLALDASLATEPDVAAAAGDDETGVTKKKKRSEGSASRRKKQAASQSAAQYEQAAKAPRQKRYLRKRRSTRLGADQR